MIGISARKFHPLVLIPFTITLAWALVMVAAPLSLPAGSVKDLSGSVGTKDNANQTKDMNAFARSIYDGGDVNCHQKASRSYFINGNEMPYCSRDIGIFFGMAIGCMLSLFIILDLKVWYIIGGLVPIGIDGGMQALGFWESINPVRLATGGLAGLITGIALGYIFFIMGTVLQDRRQSRAMAARRLAPGGPGPAGTESLGGGAGEGGARPGPQDAERDVGEREGRKD
jgi:uncharacterized membrane protein